MRIVAGAARGRRLQAPRGVTTRPTSDRVREAVMSTLVSRIGTLADARVLDLFAGSGALGLEALSRGAASVVFVESDRAVVRTLRDNIDRVGLSEAEVIVCDAGRFAEEPPDHGRVAVAHRPFDLVVCDPPYSFPATRLSEVLSHLVGQGWLADGCELVVERDARDEQAPWPVAAELTALDRRTYGDTALWYGRLVDAAR